MDSVLTMIRGGFLTAEDRKDLVELARDGSAEHRLGRRANALVLLDDGWSCESVGKALLLDDDTIRTWYRLFREEGIEGLAGFGYEGSACRLWGLGIIGTETPIEPDGLCGKPRQHGFRTPIHSDRGFRLRFRGFERAATEVRIPSGKQVFSDNNLNRSAICRGALMGKAHVLSE